MEVVAILVAIASGWGAWVLLTDPHGRSTRQFVAGLALAALAILALASLPSGTVPHLCGAGPASAACD